MSICRHVCPWNTLYGCKKPDNEPCILSNMPCAGFEKKQTNADHIRSMTDEELAKILLDGCRGSKCDDQPQNEWGSVNCFQCRMDWLKQPYKEAPNDPT